MYCCFKAWSNVVYGVCCLCNIVVLLCFQAFRILLLCCVFCFEYTLFAGRIITAAYVPLPNYNQLFPDSQTNTQPLLTSAQRAAFGQLYVPVWHCLYKSIMFNMLCHSCIHIMKICVLSEKLLFLMFTNLMKNTCICNLSLWKFLVGIKY